MSDLEDILVYNDFGIIAVIIKPHYCNRYYNDEPHYYVYLYDWNLKPICKVIKSNDYQQRLYDKYTFRLRLRSAEQSLFYNDKPGKIQFSFGYYKNIKHKYDTSLFIDLVDSSLDINNILASRNNNRILINTKVIIKYDYNKILIPTLIKKYDILKELQDIIIDMFYDLLYKFEYISYIKLEFDNNGHYITNKLTLI